VREVPPPEPETHAPEGLVCNVAFCPICMAVTATRGAAPEVIDHLIAAAREFFLAARAVIDVRADDLDGDGERRGPTRLEKIEIG
jgi:hypothetical protein